MNSGNSKTFDPHRLLLNLSEKIKLKRTDINVASSNLSIYYTWKNKTQFKITAPTWNDLTDHILYQIFKIILSIIKKNTKTDNPPIKIYVNKVDNRITFKIKTGHYLELSTTGTMILLRNTKSKKTKNEKGQNKPDF